MGIKIAATRYRALLIAAIAAAIGTYPNSRSITAHDGPHTVLYRVNAGGPAVSGTPGWSGDTGDAPSPYSNVAVAASTTNTTASAIDMSHPSVPTGTPASLFQSERWDRPEGAEMSWSFPVAAGTYEVRLYFAEIFLTHVGGRVFDTVIEGTKVLTAYDIVADVGPFKGVVKTFVVTADSSLDISFAHVTENPKISAIEILQATVRPGELGASPDSLGFGAVLVGQASTRTVQITNLGGPTDPSIGVYGTTIVGADASQFSDNFNDGTTVTLAPGQSITLSVGFAPTGAGSRTASLEISHFGINHPLVVPLTGTATSLPAGTWESRPPTGLARQEVAYVQLDGKFYLAGGSTAHQVYDPASATWSTLAPLPINVDHIQSVALNGRIYYVGGLLSFPQPATSSVFIYDPATDVLTQGAPMSRPRGAGGVAIHGGKIYYAGGLAGGSAVKWFDVYDPVGNTWTSLPDMPVARDHFHAAVVGGRFYVTGGRDTAINATISSTVAFDFATGAWQAVGLAPIPTPRGGFGAAVLGSEIIVIGGEGGGATFGTVEAYNTQTNGWRTLASMPTPRHGIQAAECNGGIYIAAGGTTQGGGGPTGAHEVFFLGSPTTCGAASPPPPPSDIQYRVNAGGASVAASPAWSADTATAPSPFSNAAVASSKAFETTAAVDTSSPTIPPGTPANVFQSERVDKVAGANMEWSFPVTPGSYEVRLYFAEIYHSAPGVRIFDVAIENNPVLENYDIVADVGAFTGVMKSFSVIADSSLDIHFGRVLENPKVNAIEILRTTPRPSQLEAFPGAWDFGSVLVGQRSLKTIGLTNLGKAGDPSIILESTSITGAAATEFSDDFNDAGSVTLAPGQSTTLTVSFEPTSGGAKAAQLQILHSGSNSPLAVALSGTGAAAGTIGFGKSLLSGMSDLSGPTSIQFGPDGRLYVGQQDGLIRIFTVARNAANSYQVTSSETISSISTVANHDDDGQLNPTVTTRLITGILVVGSASNPVIYVAHSDPRIGAGPSGDDLNLDTNSSMITRLTRTQTGWQHFDVVRGLPRSEENHAANGMQLDPATNILYVAMGGNTNKGATSNNFALLPEYALSAAILAVDLTAIGTTTYDLPTLDDETRPGNPDAGDPFGGNNGRNQARLVPGGPVQVHAAGFRNPYDLVRRPSGQLYTIDNGGNAGWGDIPVGAGPAGTCTNARNEPGTTSPDSLHRITAPGYYGGHPNPTRANKANTFNTSNPQSPVTTANPVECDYREAGPANGALAVFSASTNGLADYTAGNFQGSMQGNLLAASWNGTVYRIQLGGGSTATQVSALFSNIGSLPLDVVAESPFPGTIWVALYGENQIVALEPNDYGSGSPACSGANDVNLDEDTDGYSNKDEIDNGTNPCSAADVPPDWDGDRISDRNDPDDDNDGIQDLSDPFALDALNGTARRMPVSYNWENDGSNPGGILNLGFTGLMKNGVSNYTAQYDPSRMTAGGAAGVVTIDGVSEGDAFGSLNDQENGFQFGVWANPSDTPPFYVHTRILGPFDGLTPADGQSMGLFVGPGDQDNYAKIVISGTAGGRIGFLREIGGAAGGEISTPVAFPGPASVDLYLRVDPGRGTVQPFYAITSGGVTGPQIMLAPQQQVPTSWFTNSTSGLAVGIISTSRGPAAPFPATWDFIRVLPATGGATLTATPNPLAFGSVSVGQVQSMPLAVTSLGRADTADILISGMSVAGPQASQFSHGFPQSIRLGPGESANGDVSFAPTSAGSKTANLTITHSGVNTPLQVPLSGNGVTSAPTLAASPSALSFGAVSVGQSTPLAVQLTNSGATDIVVDSTTLTGTDAAHFGDSFDDAGDITLPPAATTTVTVTFAPSSGGAKTATLSIVHSGGNTPLQVPLSGSGVVSAPTLRVSPTALSFGSVVIGQSAVLTLQLTNLGSTTLVVDATTLTGNDASQFSDSFNDANDIALAPGASVAVTVTFAPAAAGSKTATLAIVHSGGNTPLEVSLSGSGKKKPPRQ